MDYARFMSTGYASFIVGGQFGSEAKGLVAAYIAKQIAKPNPRLICTTNAGAQAGHTTVLADATKFVCYHLPTVGVLHEMARIYLNAGSIIDLKLLYDEVIRIADILKRPPGSFWSRMTIHPMATVISDSAKQAEQTGTVRATGSTQKGIGASLAEKVTRHPYAIFRSHRALFPWAKMADVDLNHQTALVEVPQGTGLSLNSSGFYPKVTSRECWIGQAMADAGIHPSRLGRVNMVVRTFPIRVGHIYGQDGSVVGHSGPFYCDGEEISWNFLTGIQPERTTVTNRVRRIARWSRQQYRHALRMNRPDNVFLTFVNYCTPVELRQIVTGMRQDESMAGLDPQHFYSWGPQVDEVTDQLEEAMLHCTLQR